VFRESPLTLTDWAVRMFICVFVSACTRSCVGAYAHTIVHICGDEQDAVIKYGDSVVPQSDGDSAVPQSDQSSLPPAAEEKRHVAVSGMFVNDRHV
jgi:hypothetical protein